MIAPLPALPAPYAVADALEFMRALPQGGAAVRGVATSPPYNKFRRRKPHPSDRWQGSQLQADGGYAAHADNMAPDAYVAWQREIIAAALALVGPEGVVLYNTGRHHRALREDRREAIIAGYPVRQTVIWNRGSTHNLGGAVPSIFPPVYELIYIIAGERWRLPPDVREAARKWGDVWAIGRGPRSPHPAPFPLALAERMIRAVGGPVADPFAGSGTIGIAAYRLGVAATLADHAPAYAAMYADRLAAEREQPRLAEAVGTGASERAHSPPVAARQE